jgi:DNA invertase Pin-like site-specific DNA recombinase
MPVVSIRGEGKIKAAIYCRISDSRENLENQLNDLQKAVEQRGYELVASYVETVSSYKPNSRQYELEKALLDAESHKFDVMLCWALDRISRQGVAGTFILIESFRVNGVKVISLKDSWTEFPNEFTPLLTAIISWASRFESSRKSQRVKAGLVTARAKGKHIGRPVGKRDKVTRRKSGYVRRWERQREMAQLNDKIALNKAMQNVTSELEAAPVLSGNG